MAGLALGFSAPGYGASEGLSATQQDGAPARRAGRLERRGARERTRPAGDHHLHATRRHGVPGAGDTHLAAAAGGAGSDGGADPRQRAARRRADEDAVGEKELPLVELKGASGPGYYFSATDKAPA